MKTLKFNFSHPFKGHALIKMLGAGNPLYRNSFVDSQNSSFIELPLNGFLNGNCKMMLNWEIDKRFLGRKQNFANNNKPNFNFAIS